MFLITKFWAIVFQVQRIYLGLVDVKNQALVEFLLSHGTSKIGFDPFQDGEGSFCRCSRYWDGEVDKK